MFLYTHAHKLCTALGLFIRPSWAGRPGPGWLAAGLHCPDSSVKAFGILGPNRACIGAHGPSIQRKQSQQGTILLKQSTKCMLNGLFWDQMDLSPLNMGMGPTCIIKCLQNDRRLAKMLSSRSSLSSSVHYI